MSFPLKFWLFAAAAAFVVLLEISAVWNVVDWWGVAYKACGPNCVSTPGPFTRGLPALAYVAVLFVLGAFLVWRAVRACTQRS